MPEVNIEIRPRKAFRAFIESTKRWDCLIVHRRGGKTFHSLAKLLKRAFEDKRPKMDMAPKRYAYIAPTQAQAKDISWSYLKRFVHSIPGVQTNEAELKITFADGMTIRLYSGDNYERMRGLYFDGVVIDEPEDIDPIAWPSVIRPCLSDYQGWAIWIGTVKGKKGQWKRYVDASQDEKWFTMLLKASDSQIIPEEELDDIRSGTDPDIYRQEFECDPNIGRPGALFAKFVTAAEVEKRIQNFTWERSELVHTFWDLGSPRNTRCTYVQFVGREIQIIDHDHDLDMQPAERVAYMKNKGYYFGDHFFPHDAAAIEKSGKNFQQQMQEAGLEGIRIIPRCPDIWPGINKLAEIFPRMVFRKSHCEYLLESLENYRTKLEKDSENSFTNRIVEDWSCHSTDSMRMLAQSMLEGMIKGSSEIIRMTKPNHLRQTKARAGNYRG